MRERGREGKNLLKTSENLEMIYESVKNVTPGRQKEVREGEKYVCLDSERKYEITRGK